MKKIHKLKDLIVKLFLNGIGREKKYLKKKIYLVSKVEFLYVLIRILLAN